ncbi:(2Fe-2S)-binding protein [Oceanobacillus profundus]|uniref:(2Fe-2S)-binding protein n=1 Tax=Oceanobacillus profundus TaxID=372463 RepID=UPI002041A5EB|nr:(2Fe-2S)-binding protein [Oceanobacillus profundus]MCM3399964.1 (2Fe-2S)-binding protein [Oceanobacillus profundus]
MTLRVTDHPILGKLEKKKAVTFTFNDKQYTGYEDESLAAALLANEIRTLRHQEESGSSRGIYCNIGHCFECRVSINGKQGVRACLTPLKGNMIVESHGKLPTPVRDWRSSDE